MFKKTTSVLLIFAVSGCATLPAGQADTRTEVQKAMTGCVAAVATGAILGALLGNNTGSGDARRGAATGAAAGGVLCAVMLAMASERDKAEINRVRALAIQNGGRQTSSYRGSDGLQRTINITANEVAGSPPAGADVQIAALAPRWCREVRTNIVVEGKGEANIPPGLVCRNSDGTWPRSDLTV